MHHVMVMRDPLNMVLIPVYSQLLPYLEGISSIHSLRTCHVIDTRDSLNMLLIPMYSQLPSISGGHLLHNAWMHYVMVTDPLNMVLIPIYSQLPSISGGNLFHPQPKDALCHGERDPLNMAVVNTFIYS
jgi:hypothetical protein